MNESTVNASERKRASWRDREIAETSYIHPGYTEAAPTCLLREQPRGISHISHSAGNSSQTSESRSSGRISFDGRRSSSCPSLPLFPSFESPARTIPLLKKFDCLQTIPTSPNVFCLVRIIHFLIAFYLPPTISLPHRSCSHEEECLLRGQLKPPRMILLRKKLNFPWLFS